jgi:hypothetical protein
MRTQNGAVRVLETWNVTPSFRDTEAAERFD